MKQTRNGTISYNNSNFNAEYPIICPYCGAYMQPSQQGSNAIAYNEGIIIIVNFKVVCCDKLFFCTYERLGKNSNVTLLYTYPMYQLDTLPDAIHNVSLRFVELYKQANYAESMGFYELAGSGYRNALEVLIKDYAITELNHPVEEVVKKKLHKAIELYLPNVRLINSADVVRVLGNDNTHYERKYKDFDFNILKQYLEIFVKAIETEYLINHPVIPSNRS